jgi:hypothetical protein
MVLVRKSASVPVEARFRYDEFERERLISKNPFKVQDTKKVAVRWEPDARIKATT